MKIKETEDTPNVILENGIFEISGKSMPENVVSFYKPILDEIEKYNSSIDINIKLVYFNTSSSKMIMDLLIKFETVLNNGNNVKVKWFYNIDDDDMKEAGEEYADLVDIPFEYVIF